MSTYPVDIKSTTAATIAVHNALGTGAPGRALGLFVSKEGGQGVTTVKIKDNTTVIGEFLFPASTQTNATGYTQYMQFPGTGLRASTSLKFEIVTTATSVTLLHGQELKVATITYTVTVASGTNQYGTGNKFYINGEVSPVLYLQEGNTYIFDQSDSSNAVGGTHILAFSTTANGTHAVPAGTAYTTGVTTTGTPGTAGANTTIVVAPVRTTGAPLLFYYCTAHSGMGNTAQTISPTSGETEFNPQIDEIIEEAYERTGVLGTRTGYQLRSARRSLNIMFQEWGNRGVHLWKIKLAKVPLVEGQAEYNYASDSTNFPDDIDSVLEAYYRNNSDATAPADIALTKIDRSAYSATPNKLAKGTPSQYYVQRQLNPSIFLYTTPSSSVSDSTTPSNFQFCFYYLSKIQDVGAYNNTSDVVNRFYPCMISGLAYYLSQKVSPERSGELERRYESEMLRALDADNQGTSSFISPQTFYGDGV